MDKEYDTLKYKLDRLHIDLDILLISGVPKTDKRFKEAFQRNQEIVKQMEDHLFNEL
ncbi:hypothetical protein [Listeria monocytogenes]|uniref:hypothetical protein n=1 Tax=Listeria monocytogenes TaxID=1639 RepID=UPI00264B8D54|nr:hypothetical protein [Listeria monocytogenes]MDN7308560.1 hypothetical protein [Listeria monocytogenes]MDN7313673.1 hypothetical protein [Listeria monocytogenes]